MDEMLSEKRVLEVGRAARRKGPAGRINTRTRASQDLTVGDQQWPEQRVSSKYIMQGSRKEQLE